jgi:UDP-2,4-diacetamido-2,4,6-trideoxy-beta-L-altropyranose hydrolase
MRVAIRVDASHQIGTGHFMRCLTLADGLKKRGAQIRFVSRHLPGHLQDMLKMRWHESAMLDGTLCETAADELAHAHWLGVGQEADAQGCIEALADHVWEWLVVDHYALDTRWESELQKVVKNILVIDDLADRVHACDVLLDQNFYGDMDTRYVGKVPAQCRLWLGPRYALLRDEFRQWREQIEPRKGAVRRVLVFFGGVDAANYTGRTVGALAALGIGRLLVDVVIGEQHPCREQIELACVQHQFICNVQTNRMAELMAAADLSIGAGGSATWERCCLGLPALVISLADNQVEIAKSLDQLGACRYLAPREVSNEETFRKVMLDLLSDTRQVAELSKRAYSIVDGRGVDRLCGALGY